MVASLSDASRSHVRCFKSHQGQLASGCSNATFRDGVCLPEESSPTLGCPPARFRGRSPAGTQLSLDIGTWTSSARRGGPSALGAMRGVIGPGNAGQLVRGAKISGRLSQGAITVKEPPAPDGAPCSPVILPRARPPDHENAPRPFRPASYCSSFDENRFHLSIRLIALFELTLCQTRFRNCAKAWVSGL